MTSEDEHSRAAGHIRGAEVPLTCQVQTPEQTHRALEAGADIVVALT